MDSLNLKVKLRSVVQYSKEQSRVAKCSRVQKSRVNSLEKNSRVQSSEVKKSEVKSSLDSLRIFEI